MRSIQHSDRNTPVAAFRVCRKLQPHLAVLIGKAGFQALMGRALSVATSDARWLRAVEVAPDGSLSMLGEPPAALSARQVAEGGVDLITALLDLLIAFIGEQLTWCLMDDVWPQLPSRALDFDGESRHET